MTAPKNAAGRKSAYLDEVRAGRRMEDAAWMAGIQPATLRQWRKRDPEFRKMEDEARRSSRYAWRPPLRAGVVLSRKEQYLDIITSGRSFHDAYLSLSVTKEEMQEWLEDETFRAVFDAEGDQRRVPESDRDDDDAEWSSRMAHDFCFNPNPYKGGPYPAAKLDEARRRETFTVLLLVGESFREAIYCSGISPQDFERWDNDPTAEESAQEVLEQVYSDRHRLVMAGVPFYLFCGLHYHPGDDKQGWRSCPAHEEVA